MKHIITKDGDPVNSKARKAIANSLPVFSFSGPLEIGASGYWSPPHNIRLVNGWVQSKTIGTELAGLVIIAESSLDQIILAEVQMAASAMRTTFTFANAVISPYNRLFIASFSASGHEDVSIQMYGERA